MGSGDKWMTLRRMQGALGLFLLLGSTFDTDSTPFHCYARSHIILMKCREVQDNQK